MIRREGRVTGLSHRNTADKMVTVCEKNIQYVASNMGGTGYELCKVGFKHKVSQNKLDGSEQPEREDQQISGRLKSPTRIRNFSLAARVSNQVFEISDIRIWRKIH